MTRKFKKSSAVWFRLSWVILVGFLVACGGGSKENPVPAGAFTLNAGSPSFTARQGSGVVPAAQSFPLTVTGPGVAYVGAAYVGGATQPGWLGIDLTGAGTSFMLRLSIRSTSYSPGTYTSTFSVGTADQAGKVLQSQSITVAYTVTEALSFVTAPVVRSCIFGDALQAENLSLQVRGQSQEWTLRSSATWLQVPSDTFRGAQTVTAVLDPRSLAPGTYETTLQATNKTDSTDIASLGVRLTVTAPTLSLAQGNLVFGGTDGLAPLTSQPLAFTLSTGAGLHPFTITTLTQDGGSWLKVDRASGSVGAAGGTAQISIDRTGLRGGTYTGSFTLTANVLGATYTETRTVTLNLEANRLVPSTLGVAFTKLADRSVLARKVAVHSTLGRTDVPWSARSNCAWLTVTPSGNTGGTLELTADPTGLPLGITQVATVTLVSSDPTVENQPTLRVGLYISDATAGTITLDTMPEFLATSPVEPLVALSSGNSTTVELVNVFDGTVAARIPSAAAKPGAVAFSEDGRHLFVYDQTNMAVNQFDLQNGTRLAVYNASNGGGSGRGIIQFHPNGHSMLVTPSGQMYDLESGSATHCAVVPMAGSAFSLKASPDQSLLLSHSGGLTRVTRSALEGGKVVVESRQGAGTAEGRDGEACFSASGDRIYTASGAPYDFPATSLATLTVVQRLPGGPYPNAIQSSWNGLVIGGIDGYYDGNDIWIYDGPTGVNLGMLSSNARSGGYRSLRDRGLVLSADGLRVVSTWRYGYPGTTGGTVIQNLPIR